MDHNSAQRNIDSSRDLALHPRRDPVAHSFDAVVVGAGFAGLYLLHRLRELGLSVRALEAAGDVGGTWYWNRYPGARCDVESLQYSYSFSERLQDHWEWTERFATQPEILRYLNHVADHFDLRRDIQFDTRVAAARFDAGANRWVVTTDGDERFEAQWCIMATGALSAAQMPDVKGRDSFAGHLYHTGNWPHQGVDFGGLRVAVIGTGSSGIQAIPVIAEQCAHLTVFQRTPHYSVPARNQLLESDFRAQWKQRYNEHRRRAREETPSGILFEFPVKSALAATEDERMQEYERRWLKGGSNFAHAYNDFLLDRDANETAAAFVREKIRQTVHDPNVAETLTPRDYPIFTKRICVDTGYYETFNRPNVTLVDLRKTPISEIVPSGIQTGERVHEADAIVFATGFDALTGALARIEIAGEGGVRLVDKWRAGPRTYLGLMSAGFPNMFFVTGPGSPSVLSNVVVSIEQHVDWITECIATVRHRQLSRVEATLEAEDDWVEHLNELASKTLLTTANSWYLGANIVGKPRVFMPYVGGVGTYRALCSEIASNGYRGFVLSRPAEQA